MRLALALTSAQADRLRKEADRLGIAPAVLVRATLEDLCDLPDAGFRAAAERIVPKNQELSLASPDQGVEHVDTVSPWEYEPTLLNGEPVSVRFTATVTCIPGDADQTTTGGAPVFGNFVLPEEPPPTPSTSPAPSHRSRRGDSVVSCHAYSRPGRRPDHVAAPL